VFAHLHPRPHRPRANQLSSAWIARNASIKSYHHEARSSQSSAFRTPRVSRKFVWIISVAGGISLYLTSDKQEFSLRAFFSSPTIIPCTDASSTSSPDPPINSPAEVDRSILSWIGIILRERVWEPVLTARRFVHLLLLFIPVLFSAPMLFVGPTEASLHGDRWGAVWWYDFLTAQMQRAGPTFVKVRNKLYI